MEFRIVDWTKMPGPNNPGDRYSIVNFQGSVSHAYANATVSIHPNETLAGIALQELTSKDWLIQEHPALAKLSEDNWRKLLDGQLDTAHALDIVQPWYADYDENSGLWGVFHLDTGLCRATFCTEQEAREKAEEYNS